jgi:hypothetical protein
MVWVLTPLLDRKTSIIGMIKPPCSAYGEVSAWRVCNHQIPYLTLGKIIIFAILKMATSILDNFQDILMEMPFGMPAAAFQNIAAVSVMSSLSESLANGLALFASN